MLPANIQYFIQNKNIIVTIVFIAKIVRVIADIVIIVFFAKFILFFIKFRSQERRLSNFNILILSLVLFIFVLCIYQSLYSYVTVYFYFYPLENYQLTNYFFQLVNSTLFNWKDFLIALMLSYLFYFKGMQQVKENMLVTRELKMSANIVSINISKEGGETEETGRFRETESVEEESEIKDDQSV